MAGTATTKNGTSRPATARRAPRPAPETTLPVPPPSPLAERYAIDRPLRKAVFALALAGRIASEIEGNGIEFCRADNFHDCQDVACFCEAILPLLPSPALDDLPDVDLGTIARKPALCSNPAILEWLIVVLDRVRYWLAEAGWGAENYGDEKEWTKASRQIIGLGAGVTWLQSLVDCDSVPFAQKPYEEKIDAILRDVE